MLIEDGNLNTVEFKKLFKTLDWVKAPRTLSKRVKEYFYIASLEDDTKIIKVSVRPSMRMKVQESFKNKLVDGSDPKNPKDPNAKYTFGTTIEVLIDEDLMGRIKKVSKILEPDEIQKISWS